MAGTLKINWSFTSRIDGGPQLAESVPVVEVSAYDFIRQVLPTPIAPATSTTTDVHLGGGTNPAMVVILASKYSDKVKYTVDAVGTDHILDAPHLFIGAGAVPFLGAVSPQKLTFTNASADAVTVQVFVGRPA
jgi:hypothetical protein